MTCKYYGSIALFTYSKHRIVSTGSNENLFSEFNNQEKGPFVALLKLLDELNFFIRNSFIMTTFQPILFRTFRARNLLRWSRDCFRQYTSEKMRL